MEAQLVVGAVAIVAGGAILAAEPDRPVHLRSSILCALGAAVLFAIRDNIVRFLHAHGAPRSPRGGDDARGHARRDRRGTRTPSRGGQIARPAGLLFGFSYICLFEAYFHGRVSVVAPLIATESLWGVGLAALVIGRSEAVGWRVVAGALGIVAGSALIGLAAG